MNQSYDLGLDLNPPDQISNPITPLMIEHLRATKPWVRFISIMLFISVGLIFLGALVILLVPAGKFSGISAVMALVYILLGLLYLFPAYFLHQYASSIRDLEQGGGDSAMEAALGSQKSFWRFIGILTLVLVSIYAVVIVFAVLSGVFMRR